MAYAAFMMWLFPFFPATPKLGPVYQHITHMVPMEFPLLVIVPAFLLDLLRPRVAAAILLLYAQPVTRIVRITTDDVIRDGGQVLLRLGEPPSPVPEPVAGLLLEWIGSRDNMNTAANRNSPWLFPGRRAGQPINADSLATQVNDIGVPTIGGRASAIRRHVLVMPSPVVADALGYHPVTTARLAAQSGGTFSRYAPGDHERPTAAEGDS